MPGLFIAFEGLDGSGKSTVLGQVAHQITDLGLPVMVTREPGGTPLGLAIRELLLGQNHRPTARAELLLMCADRAEHVSSVIQPALDAGNIVLTDRYAASTRAYQGGGLGLPVQEVEAAISAATGGIEPDLYVLFGVDPEVATSRRSRNPATVNALDLRTIEFKQQVRAKYLAMAQGDSRWVVVDANQPLDVVSSRVFEVVRTRLHENQIAT